MTLYGEDPKDGWAQLRRSVVKLLDYTDESDLRLLIEPAHEAESTPIRTVAEGLRMIEEIRSERLGIVLDTGHASLNGENLAEVIRQLAGVPLHIHIDDNTGDGDAHLIPGDGNIDFEPFAQALKEVGYDGFISAELGIQYALNPDAAVEKAFARLKKQFG